MPELSGRTRSVWRALRLTASVFGRPALNAGLAFGVLVVVAVTVAQLVHTRFAPRLEDSFLAQVPLPAVLVIVAGLVIATWPFGSPRIDIRARARCEILLEQVQLEFGSHDEGEIGRELRRANATPDSIPKLIPALRKLAQALLFSVGALIVIVDADWRLTIAISALAPVWVCARRISVAEIRLERRLASDAPQRQALMAVLAKDEVRVAETGSVAVTARRRFAESLDELVEQDANACDRQRMRAFVSTVALLAALAIADLVFGFGVIIPGPRLLAGLLVGVILGFQTAALIQAFGQVTETMAGFGILVRLVDRANAPRTDADGQELPSVELRKPPAVVFDHVVHEVPDGRRIHFHGEFASGAHVVFVGPGRAAMLALALGLLPPDEGRILYGQLIDGQRSYGDIAGGVEPGGRFYEGGTLELVGPGFDLETACRVNAPGTGRPILVESAQTLELELPAPGIDDRRPADGSPGRAWREASFVLLRLAAMWCGTAHAKLVGLNEPLTSRRGSDLRKAVNKLARLLRGTTSFIATDLAEIASHADVVCFVPETGSVVVGGHTYLLDTNVEYRKWYEAKST